ncbi:MULTISPECIES: VanZ family protein [Paenibacillus]|jgi:glycopeptide antibiotics resistance protein|uniref:VanZ family protein n=1 Tax=Paenibacillus TaxID=44249 RepID=UPI0004B381C1|nr:MULTISPECIES: VanZ family protein [Paenibacillus]MEC2345227.1 VanZ family protein [Paenibacillus barengoltzii]SME94619.1 Glycopeptide antibiotics resistance protein [Paenibacillus barengoltzii]
MFKSYLYPVTFAFGVFPIAALLFTLPFLVVQYRRHGYVNKVRALVLYLFLLYLMNAIFLVMLPLPTSRHNLPLSGGALQLIPFHFIHDIMKETSIVPGEPSTYWRLLQERAVWQVLLNVALTVPFGMMLRYYFRSGPIASLILSFLLSLFIEVTQLTGIYGIYDHPYRVFDVDDLMTNTLGGMLGFLLAEWLSRYLPRIEHLDRGVDLTTKRVSYTRRGLALMFDYIVLGMLMTVIHEIGIKQAYFVSTGIYFMLIPYLTGGRTPGKWLVRIQLIGLPADQGERKPSGRVAAAVYNFLSASRERQPAGLLPLVVRYGLLYWGVFGLNRLLVFPDNYAPSLFRILLAIIILVANVAFAIHVAKHFFRREPLLFYEQISRTGHAIILKEKAREATVSNRRKKSSIKEK